MTPKQQRFVEEYLIDLNAKQAAIRAGYSATTAEQQGYQLLHHPSVAAAVAGRIEQRSRQAGIDAAWVLREAQSVYQVARDAERLPDALKALELIGKHVKVQAFAEQGDHRQHMSVQEAMKTIAHLLPKYRHLLPPSLKVIEVGHDEAED